MTTVKIKGFDSSYPFACLYCLLSNAASGAGTIKHYRFVIYELGGKLVCLSKPVKSTDIKKTLAYHKISPFFVNYEYRMFYISGPRSLYHKTFYGRN
jgi:hypothetical protein